MDSAKMILTESVGPPAPLKHLDKIDGVSEEKKKEYAKDFESVFIHKLLEEMKDTIGDWGFEKDGTSKQVQGIFSLYLAGDIASNGGLGMWQDIYRFFTDMGQKNTVTKSLDENV